MTFARTFRPGDEVTIDLQFAVPLTRGTFRRIAQGGRDEALVDVAGALVRVPYAALRHAPVDVVGPARRPDPTTCPDCGAPLDIDDAATRYTPRRGFPPARRVVRVAFCSGCEYVREVPR